MGMAFTFRGHLHSNNLMSNAQRGIFVFKSFVDQKNTHKQLVFKLFVLSQLMSIEASFL